MLIVSLPTIVAFYVQSFVYVPSLSSPLLLRISPNTFAFISIPPMSLSSRNRSNSKAFRHILPCIAPVCEGMHYHKTGVPWQMKRIATGVSCIFIIVLFLLVLPRNALPRLSSRSRQSQNARLCKHIGTLRSLLRVFCKGFWDYGKML